MLGGKVTLCALFWVIVMEIVTIGGKLFAIKIALYFAILLYKGKNAAQACKNAMWLIISI